MRLPYSWSVLEHTERKLKTGYLSEKVELLGTKHQYLMLPWTAGQDPATGKAGRDRWRRWLLLLLPTLRNLPSENLGNHGFFSLSCLPPHPFLSLRFLLVRTFVLYASSVAQACLKLTV